MTGDHDGGLGPTESLPRMVASVSRQLEALTSLRFFAALAVVLFHVPYVLPRSVGLTLLPNGSLGVSFFFILSGFILKHSYPGPAVTLAEFYQRRAARILPLYYVTLIIWTTLFFRHWGNNLPDKVNSGIANLLVLQAFFSGPLFTLGYNAVSWSISVELFFYALFPVLVRGRRCFIVLAIYVLLFLLMPRGVVQMLQAAFGDFFYFNPVARLLEFVCGMSLYALFRAWAPRMGLASVLQFGSLLLLVVLVPVTSGLPPHLMNVALLLPFSAIILTFAWDGALSRLLSWPVLVLLGEASFALYLIHHMYFRLFDDRFQQMDKLLVLHTGRLTALFLAIGSAILLSVIVFRFFERPVRILLTRRGTLGGTRRDSAAGSHSSSARAVRLL